MIRLDDVLGYKNLKIFQDSNFFSFSLDSIVLANYTRIRLRDRKIIDFCTGNAVVPLILSQRCSHAIDCVEIQKSLSLLASKSISVNNLNDRIFLYNMDVKDFCNISNNQSSYDLVLCNPPYFKNNVNSTKNIVYEKKVARHEILISLEEVIRCAMRILKDNGCFSMVHRTDRLVEIIDLMKKYNLEPKSIKFVYQRVDSPSSLVLIQAQKNGKVGLTVEKPLILYKQDGSISEEYSLIQNEVI